MQIAIIFLASFAATILSSMSGSGTSIITLPIYLSLGINLPTAIAISQICGIFWVLPASYNYLKGRKIDVFFIILFSLIGLVGVYLGVFTNITFNQRILEIIIGIIIVSLVLYSYFKKDLGLKEKHLKTNIFRKILVYPFALILGFYEGFFGSGNGILFSITTFHLKGFDFIDALGHYYAIAFFWVVFGSFLYIKNGYFNIWITIPAVIGSILGGYLGSRLGKYKGNKIIKTIFILAGSVLGLKLILGL